MESMAEIDADEDSGEPNNKNQKVSNQSNKQKGA